jgi:hypothetical protein
VLTYSVWRNNRCDDLLLRAGKAKRTGVLTPEEAFDPADYFAVLAALAGVEGEMVELVTVP